MTAKAQVTREKVNKLDFVKVVKFYAPKGSTEIVRRRLLGNSLYRMTSTWSSAWVSRLMTSHMHQEGMKHTLWYNRAF